MIFRSVIIIGSAAKLLEAKMRKPLTLMTISALTLAFSAVFVPARATCAIPERCFDRQGRWICPCDDCARQGGLCRKAPSDDFSPTGLGDWRYGARPANLVELLRVLNK